MRQIIFDTETTGMNFNARDKSEGHRIIELGCVEAINRRPTGRNLHLYFKPDRKVEEEALAVHGITDEFLSDKPTFAEKLEEIESFLEGADELIAHNSNFDCQFLNRELKLANRDYRIEQKFNIVDSLQIAKKRFPGQKNNLDALCKRFRVDNSNREKHGALLDSELLLEVYLKLTGGQTNLFSGISTTTHTNQQTTQQETAVTVNNTEWLIAKASDEEIRKHEEIMQSLRS